MVALTGKLVTLINWVNLSYVHTSFLINSCTRHSVCTKHFSTSLQVF